MSQQIALMSLDEFDRYWPAIAIELDRVPQVWNETWTKDELRNSVLRLQCQAWAVIVASDIRSVVFTQIVNYPAGRALEVGPMFGNSMVETLDLLTATMERFADIQDCTYIRATMRPGFEKFLSPRFEGATRQIVLTREVRKQRMQ